MSSEHDNQAAKTADAVDKLTSDAARGKVSDVPSTTSVDPVTVEPASAEQEALDASYKSGESPYEITAGAVDEEKVEALKREAEAVMGDK